MMTISRNLQLLLELHNINEWERIHLLTKINENNDGFTCICGQVGLERLHFFQNKINKNEIIVGSGTSMTLVFRGII